MKKENNWEFDFSNNNPPKLTQEFLNTFTVDIKGRQAITIEGLSVLGHQKGIWKMNTHIIQFPMQENKWTAIAECTIGGYDYNPITGEVIQVEYTDFADANADNCSKMVANSYIRMAGTRAQARALRKYVNLDLVCTSEMSDVEYDTRYAKEPVKMMEKIQFDKIKNLIAEKVCTREEFNDLLDDNFGKEKLNQLTKDEAESLISLLITLKATKAKQLTKDSEEKKVEDKQQESTITEEQGKDFMPKPTEETKEKVSELPF